jgi:hypothetical protein
MFDLIIAEAVPIQMMFVTGCNYLIVSTAVEKLFSDGYLIHYTYYRI